MILELILSSLLYLDERKLTIEKSSINTQTRRMLAKKAKHTTTITTKARNYSQVSDI
jgi:hypothetical protein